ncbi:MAG: hypothetical protein ACRC8A_12805 [Microcoleaceae cyanobacterium]
MLRLLWKSLGKVLALGTMGGFTLFPGVMVVMDQEPAIAQDNPAPSFRPGPWQPVARINPNAPYKIVIKNQAGIDLEYSLTTGDIDIRTVPKGGTTELTNLPREVFLLINPSANAREASLRYEIQVGDDNSVNVAVMLSSDPSGVRTVNIQPDGAIYKY